ncbi:TBC1 domain family member 7 isoform X2 [Agrilus planipennis]|nr:TBC1 domain family member 7 isoform X2 [Agrilus planipennis]
MEQRNQEFKDLLHVVQVMRLVDGNTSKPQVFLIMWLLQSGNLGYDFNTQYHRDYGFINIVQSLMEYFHFTDDIDIYWIAKSLYGNIIKIETDFPKLLECTCTILEREDNALYKYLQGEGILNNLPLEKWYKSCLAGVLNDSALAKIWDKLCGGSNKILVFAVISLLINQKYRLLTCTTLNQALDYLKNISDDAADVIANQSIEMWQQNGSPLTVHDKPKP